MDALVAMSASEMPAVQAQLTEWCEAKVAQLRAEMTDIATNRDLARKHKWKVTPWQARVNRVQKQIDYYVKIQRAVEAGYVIVPNMPCTFFAVRVKRVKPIEKVKPWRNDATNVSPLRLPAGEGRYVRDSTSYFVETEKTEKGERTFYRTADFEDVSFPVQVVKPIVLDATAQAMERRIFDAIGLVDNQAGRDPLVVGVIEGPNWRRATFFVAWWLDPSTL